jgi:hypothetical protein
MSFQRAIPWRFALPHGPPPLRSLAEVYNRAGLLERKIQQAANCP